MPTEKVLMAVSIRKKACPGPHHFLRLRFSGQRFDHVVLPVENAPPVKPTNPQRGGHAMRATIPQKSNAFDMFGLARQAPDAGDIWARTRVRSASPRDRFGPAGGRNGAIGARAIRAPVRRAHVSGPSEEGRQQSRSQRRPEQSMPIETRLGHGERGWDDSAAGCAFVTGSSSLLVAWPTALAERRVYRDAESRRQDEASGVRPVSAREIAASRE